MTKLIKVFN